MTKRDIHQNVLARIRSLPTEGETASRSEIRSPRTYMGQVGVELKMGLQTRIEQLEAQLAGGDIVLRLDPKRIRATEFRNRDIRSLRAGDEPFDELKEDIRKVGNKAPIEVRAVANDPAVDYEIISGHRRHAACLQLDAEIADGFQVRALIVGGTSDPIELVKGMHRENYLREDPSPSEYGILYAAALKANVFRTQKELAAAIGISEATLSNHLFLIGLPPDVFAAFDDPRTISVRWVPQLSKALKDHPEQVIATAQRIAALNEKPSPEQIKTELVRPPHKTSAAPEYGRYEQTIRLADKKTVGVRIKRDGRHMRLSVGATITTEALLRKITDKIESVLRDVLREEEKARHG